MCKRNPIVGPRYTSKVETNYDLCKNCYGMVNIFEQSKYSVIYTPMERPQLVRNPRDVSILGLTVNSSSDAPRAEMPPERNFFSVPPEAYVNQRQTQQSAKIQF
jgi:hypothetical protein